MKFNASKISINCIISKTILLNLYVINGTSRNNADRKINNVLLLFIYHA